MVIKSMVNTNNHWQNRGWKQNNPAPSPEMVLLRLSFEYE